MLELQGDVGHVESCFSPLETVLVFVQDGCMVILTEAQVEARFVPFGDSANLDGR